MASAESTSAELSALGRVRRPKGDPEWKHSGGVPGRATRFRRVPVR
jgi:hypothetical protein